MAMDIRRRMRDALLEKEVARRLGNTEEAFRERFDSEVLPALMEKEACERRVRLEDELMELPELMEKEASERRQRLEDELLERDGQDFRQEFEDRTLRGLLDGAEETIRETLAARGADHPRPNGPH
jgi:hypothetical protein